MKIFYFLSNLCKSRLDSQSVRAGNLMHKMCSVLTIFLTTVGVGKMHGTNDTVNISISSYATAQKWSGNSAYRTVTSGSVTLSAHDNGGNDTGSNTGKYVSSDNSWRLYESEKSYLTIDAGSGNELVSFKITFTVDNSGTFSYGGSAIASNTAKNVASGNQSTSTGTVGHSSGTKSGQIRITAIQVVYNSSCTNSVTISNGTATNCTFSLSPSGAQASCSGVATTVSITPTTGYGSPSVTQSGASATPTISGSGNTQTVTYAANTTGTSTISVSCSANNYTITLDQDLTPTSTGTTSITATYNSSSSLTSAITKPTKTNWTFAGYFTAKNGGGTQIIDADGNVIASANDGGINTYTDASKNWKYADNITLYAKWTCTVTWSVNKATNVYSAQTVTYNSSGCKVGSVPSGSDLDLGDYCGDKFVGWTSDESYVHGTSNLFTTVAGSPELKTVGNKTFYAVFADYAE